MISWTILQYTEGVYRGCIRRHRFKKYIKITPASITCCCTKLLQKKKKSSFETRGKKLYECLDKILHAELHSYEDSEKFFFFLSMLPQVLVGNIVFFPEVTFAI